MIAKKIVRGNAQTKFNTYVKNGLDKNDIFLRLYYCYYFHDDLKKAFDLIFDFYVKPDII